MKSFKSVLALSAVFVLAGLAFNPPDNMTCETSWSGIQEAYAGSTSFEGTPTLVSTTKDYAFSNARPRISVVPSDTGGVHQKVPGMNNGDVVTGVMYVPFDSLASNWYGARNPVDITSFAYFYRDSIQYWGEAGGNEGTVAVDSGWVWIFYNDLTD